MKIFLNKSSIEAINQGFFLFDKKVEEDSVKDKIKLSSLNGQITADGIIFDSYDITDANSTFGPEYQLILDRGRVINIFKVNFNDERVIKEGADIRIIRGLDGNAYLIEAEFMEYKGKKYCVFPNYMLKFDGSVQAVEGSAMENFIRLRGINENRK